MTDTMTVKLSGDGFISSNAPIAYRLARRDGELILQGQFSVTKYSGEGYWSRAYGAWEWSDLETVEFGTAPASVEMTSP